MNVSETKRVLHVEGMMCQNCAKHVRLALAKVQGVTAADVDLDTKTATVTFSGDASDEALREAIADAGYEVSGVDVA